ncbi:hypothetical protein L1049_003067 [Liquidambar formosana]|uniref:Uncharacterized protein n=1 Tax=Liquidambar formosana TaxID=63359 RepID=A0AAP0NJF0_LIQFO
MWVHFQRRASQHVFVLFWHHLEDRLCAADGAGGLGRETEGEGDEGVGTEPGGVEGGGAGGIEAGSAEETADEGEDEDEDGDKGGGDEEGYQWEGLNSKSGCYDGGDCSQSGDAKYPHESQDGVADRRLYDPHPLSLSLSLSSSSPKGILPCSFDWGGWGFG